MARVRGGVGRAREGVAADEAGWETAGGLGTDLQPQENAVSARRQNLDAAVAAWNDGDLDGYLELYDDAIALHG